MSASKFLDSDLSYFVDGYIECMLWSSNDESDPETGGEPLDRNYGPDDIAPESLTKIKKDCKAFVKSNRKDLGEYLEHRGASSAGHDFWLTRNGLGAGFWDRGLGDLGKRLSTASKRFGECNPYVGDDGKVYVD